MSKVSDPFEDHGKHLLPLPDSTLRDLARNEAAPRDYRKSAVEILWNRRSPYVKHEDLLEFVEELEIEFDGIQLEFPTPVSAPLTASITTQTLYAEPFDDHAKFTGFDDVREMDTTPPKKSLKKSPPKKEPDVPEPTPPS